MTVQITRSGPQLERSIAACLHYSSDQSLRCYFKCNQKNDLAMLLGQPPERTISFPQQA
jgi:hypothetical protein